MSPFLALLIIAQATSPHAALAMLRAASDPAATIVAPALPQKRGAGIREVEELGPEVSAQSAVVIDADSGAVLFGKRQYAVRPFASMTKLLSAIAIGETHPDWDAEIDIRADDLPNEGNTIFRAGDRVRVRDAFAAMLVHSDNGAARALTRAQFADHVAFRNATAHITQQLQLYATTIQEPTGLDALDRGAAVDAATLLRAALEHPEIAAALAEDRAVIPIGGRAARSVRITTTNRLLRTRLPGVDWHAIGGKTGYIDESGYNFVMAAEREGHRIVVAVLGAVTHDDRFRDAAVLAGWTFENYTWPTTVRAAGSAKREVVP